MLVWIYKEARTSPGSGGHVRLQGSTVWYESSHPLVNLFLSAIVNLNDGSTLVQPRVVWDVLSATRVMAGVDLPMAFAGTECGGLMAPASDRTIGAPVRASVIATWYF